MASLLAIAVACSGGVFGMLHGIVHGEADSRLAAWSMVAVVGCLAAAGWVGAAAVVWNNILRGQTKLLLAANPVPLGRPVAAVLEIPFARDAAPELTVVLELHRREQDVSDHMAPRQDCVWSETLRLSDWAPTARARCAAGFELSLPGDLDCRDAARVSFTWVLTAEPTAGDVAWNAHFTLPVEIAPAASDRLVPQPA